MLKMIENKLTKIFPVVSIDRETLVDSLEDIYGCDRELLNEFVETLTDKDMQEIADSMSIIIGKDYDISQLVETIVMYDLDEKIPQTIKGDD